MLEANLDRRPSAERGVWETTADWQHRLSEQVQRQPYITIGVAAGIGYVLGGGLQSRLTAVLLSTAARVVAALVARELEAQLGPTPGADVTAQTH